MDIFLFYAILSYPKLSPGVNSQMHMAAQRPSRLAFGRQAGYGRRTPPTPAACSSRALSRPAGGEAGA